MTSWKDVEEAKVSGRAVLVGETPDVPGGEQFRVEIAEVAYTRVNDAATMLVIQGWTPEHGLRTVERA